ncbi:hypothetical protein MRB53_014254 [Persea americana]|uniref:Uncharacterized protein n=1 Tax=Persea americana TaxID=3435 RepID=A0ACC2KAA7_PERAE|nr:hypothetical protein MRB53_014254 [Persea americana]
MLIQASHWPLLMEVEKALMKTCNDLQCSMTIMQRRCHLLQCLAHRDCHHERKRLQRLWNQLCWEWCHQSC